MDDNKFLRIVLPGIFAIAGLVGVQAYYLLKSWDLKDQEFDTTMHIILSKVANEIAKYNDTVLPKKNLIQRRSSNIYAVNVNSSIVPYVVEDFLYQEFTNASLTTDFEYAVFDCHSNELVYGNYCRFNEKDRPVYQASLPRFDEFTYYFVIKFPERESFLLSNLSFNLTFALLAILALFYFVYTSYEVARQKKLSKLQIEFINNMTHEFKTPVSSIKIAANALLNSKLVKSDEKLEKYVSIINDQNSRINNQVERVLSIASVEDDFLQLKKVDFDLVSVVEKIIDQENIKQGQELISMETNCDNLIIHADEVHFTNVIFNLIDNSLKYNEQEPKIAVSIDRDAVGKIILSIQDNGIGIPKEEQKNIFDKFYRVSTGDRHDVKGFGLGLFYNKNICEAHGWQISLQSEVRKGTKISIII